MALTGTQYHQVARIDRHCYTVSLQGAAAGDAVELQVGGVTAAAHFVTGCARIETQCERV